MELPNHAKQLLLQLNQQRAKGFLCDVIIVVENALFRAHKNILAASSMYFKSLVLHDNLINLDTDMVNPNVFRQVLDFIYTGKLCAPSDTDGEQNFGALLTAASYLQLHDLAAVCRKKLKRNGRPVPVKVNTLNSNRPIRSHRLNTSPVVHNQYSATVQDGTGPLLNELQKASDDEVYGSPNQESSLTSSRGGSKNGSSNANGSSGGEQELGLDLSKKSPSVSTPQSQDEMHLSEIQQDSPQSASACAANSASFSDPAANNQNDESSEVMEVEIPEENHSLTDTGQQRKSLRHSARKKEWAKKESTFKSKDGKVCEGSESLPNGVIVGPLGKSAERTVNAANSSGKSFSCKQEVENGKENSEESGHSESESGHTSANYVYRQEGFESVGYGDNLYVCIPCGKGFPSSEQLNTHVETHTEEELYIKEEDSYVKEEAEEAEDLSAPNPPYGTDSRPFKCSVCEKSYKDPATLRQHEKTHWLTRPFPCNICGKMFTQRGTMTRHMRSHLGLKPFACEECGMRFTRQYRLTEHMRVHSGEKPYECQLCGGKFTQQRNLISHLRMHTSPS